MMKMVTKLCFWASLSALLMIGSAVAQTVTPVSAGDGTIQAAIDVAADGDILELVDGGGLYITSDTDKIIVNKKLTIRAAEGLAQMPVVRNTNAAASSARLFEIQAGGE
ncbi:MAG: hypothetical protein KDE57_01340, partial [Calditrichaeota bacterium]|nr:hypothetical protein [Calditrichota bacterium]